MRASPLTLAVTCLLLCLCPYDYSFARGHQQSIGIGGGLLISIP